VFLRAPARDDAGRGAARTLPPGPAGGLRWPAANPASRGYDTVDLDRRAALLAVLALAAPGAALAQAPAGGDVTAEVFALRDRIKAAIEAGNRATHERA
jgi:hypothetical protein